MKLSIADIILHAYQSIKNNFSYFVSLTLVFFAITAIVEGALFFLDVRNMFLVYLFALISFAVYVKQAVTVHRSVILGEMNRWDKVFSWGAPENRFLLISIGLWLVFSLFVGILGGMLVPFFNEGGFSQTEMEQYVYILLVITLIIGGSIFSRICMMFPSAAIGKKLGVGGSIDYTQSNFFKLFLLIVLLPIVIKLLLSSLIIDDVFISALLIGFIAHLLIVFQVSVLSHTYLALVDSIEQKDIVNLDV